MDRFFTFFQNYRSGILLFLFVLFVGVFLIQWLTWVFGKGRFKLSERPKGSGTGSGTGTGDGGIKPARFIFSEATVKIINEFRHLLALLILVIFAFALAFSLIKAGSLTTGDAISNMKGAIEGVVATLGGLVGSIIGYYFGESSTARPDAKTQADSSTTQVQEPPPGKGATETKVVGGPPIKNQQPSSTEGTSTGSSSEPE